MSAFASGVYAGDVEISTLYAGETEILGLAGCEDTIYVPNKKPVSVDVLLVGGGAGGGTAFGGGGGGSGGHREYTKLFYFDKNYNVTVGAGGSASSTTASSASGSNSSIERIADGGGGGGTGGIGADGGSGGGGYAISSSDGGDSKTTRCNRPSQGNSGSSGNGAFAQAGGGGGASSSGGASGSGGDGSTTSITGSSVTRAGGGGGGDTSGGFGNTATPGTGGSGGGGAGGTGNQSNDSSQATGGNGSANTGGGGGGGAFYKNGGSNLAGSGGNGGSGFICMKYHNSFEMEIGSGLTSSTATSGDYKITQFTAGTDTISFAAASGGGGGGGDSSWTSVRLLVPFDTDANSVTHSNGQSITGTTSGTSGDPASAVTSDSKYGSGGWTHYQGTVTYSTSTFNSTNWTVEFWFKRNADYSFTTYRQVMKFGYFIFRHSSSNNFELYDDDDGSSLGGFGAAALNTWEHYAIVYQNGTTRLYKGGSQIASSTGTLSAPSSVVLGRSSHGLYNFSLDDLRVTDAARYPDGTTFTAPSAAHPTSSSSSTVSLKYDQETLGYLSQVLQVAQNANTGATIKDAAGTSVTLTLAELKHVIATMVSNNQSLVEARNKAAIDIDAATTNTAVTNVKTTFTTTYPPPSGS